MLVYRGASINKVRQYGNNMKKIALSLCLMFALAASTKSYSQPQSKPIELTHVSVIDGTGGPVESDMTIVIVANHIVQIGKAGNIHVTTEAQVIDGSGKFLIPGLWDMHVHWFEKDYLPLFIANGVTGIRQMWGFPEHFQWRKEIQKGTLLGPRMVIASPIVDGPNPIFEGSISVTSEADARVTVRKLKQDGADFIKVLELVPRDAYFAIADETKKLGIPFAGHVPISVSAVEASDAGQKSFEHLRGILETCSTREEDLRKGREDAFLNRSPDQGLPKPEKMRPLIRLMLETFNREKAAVLFEHFKKNHTWQCPTLTVLRSFAFLDDSTFQNDPRLKYMPSSIRTMWNPKTDFRFKERTSEDFELARQLYRKQVELVGMMRDAGVDFIAGTDVLNPYCFPGFSLHDELGLLVKAGLTPMEALQAGTRNPAIYLGMSDSIGTIEKGKVADLVLLDANPLQDISNTTKIAAVIAGGRFFNRFELDSMLATVQRIANRKSVADLMFKLIEEQNTEAAIKKYRDMRSAADESYDLSESELISLGYRLLQMKRVKDAIAIFRLNVEINPQSSNAFDSLGEAYLSDGDKELAIKSYRRSVELDPNNQNGIQKLKSLERQ